MNVSKEFLLEAFGLCMVVALILISIQIFQRATAVTEQLESKQEQKILELEEHEIVKYDGLYVDGMSVIGYIKTIVGTYQLPVSVVTVDNEFVVEDTALFVELRDIESEYYINPLARYLCSVARNDNGTITEIKIEVERKENN